MTTSNGQRQDGSVGCSVHWRSRELFEQTKVPAPIESDLTPAGREFNELLDHAQKVGPPLACKSPLHVVANPPTPGSPMEAIARDAGGTTVNDRPNVWPAIVRAPAPTPLCDACRVQGPWEHRCHGAAVCGCPSCREADRHPPIRPCPTCGSGSAMNRGDGSIWCPACGEAKAEEASQRKTCWGCRSLDTCASASEGVRCGSFEDGGS